MGKNVEVKIFRSPFGCATEKQALYVLDELRRTYSAKDGWYEVKAGVEKRKGRWYAWRQHFQDPNLVTK